MADAGPVVIGVPFVADADSLDGGDFATMIEQDQYRDTLFLFNDNVQDGRAKILVEGGGSAVIRPYAASDTDHQAVGIPTGWMPGVAFTTLDCQVRQCINHAFGMVITSFCTYRYRRVVFPCDSTDRTAIGTGIFRNVGPDVIAFINENIRLLPSRLARGTYMSFPFLRWSMSWVDYRLTEERDRLQRRRFMLTSSDRGASHRVARRDLQGAPSEHILTTPTGLVQKAQDMDPEAKRRRVNVPSLY